MKYEQGRRRPQIVIAISVTDSDDKKIEIGFKFYPLEMKVIICHLVISDGVKIFQSGKISLMDSRGVSRTKGDKIDCDISELRSFYSLSEIN